MSAADHFRHVYSEGVEEYQQLVEFEDASGHLWQHLDDLVDWADREVVELGAGTGRLTVPLARRVRHVHAADASSAMLHVARRRLDAVGLDNVTLHVAEHRRLPFRDGSADALLEGWAVAHYVDWEPHTWPVALNACVTEMRRVTEAGCPIVLVETLGTGVTQPAPPSAAIADLYARLEDDHGFTRTWVRTDYRFRDAATAVATVTRFFGDDMATHVQGVALPECTGVWFTHS